MAKKQDWIIGGFIFGFLAIFTFFLILIIMGLGSSGEMTISPGGSRVAIIELNGIITSSDKIVQQFKKYQKDASVKSIVFRINSPGGGIAASQEIYEHVKRVRDGGKPVVASMGSVAASGGYYVALGSQMIMANPGTTTGSIGVIAEIPNFSRLLDKIGVSFTIIKSGRFKDTGSPYRNMRSDEYEYLQGWIDNGYKQFVQVVSKERNLPEEKVREVADGRVYTGEQALGLSLIDTLGTYDDAIHLAAKLGGITGEPRILRDRLRKVTLFDIITEDTETLISKHFSLWPQAKYIMKF
ncbi:signal peptide peptidase SppA [candidate division KSB1 bacterium]|nr:signal peptide peptidase SppA [candidate division KSB1 bacterium]